MVKKYSQTNNYLLKWFRTTTLLETVKMENKENCVEKAAGSQNFSLVQLKFFTPTFFALSQHCSTN